jgi:predicted aldo/keto reductase-like oxidoreductase
MKEPALQRAAMEAGVNYWHKGGPYLAAAIKEFGREKQYVELCIDASGSAEKDEENFKSHLKDGLEYADLYKMHGAYDPKSVEAFHKLKDKGLAKYLSASFHDYAGAVKALKTGELDAIQVAGSPVAGEKLAPVLDAARQADAGVILMKTMMGGEKGWENAGLKKALEPYTAKGLSTPQAIAAACLAINGVTSLVIVTGSIDRFNALVAGAAMGATRTAAACRGGIDLEFCAVCGACAGVCPEGVAVNDLMRFDMYARGYGDVRRAKALYSQLPPARTAASCRGCGTCAGACPFGVASPTRVAAAGLALA